MGSNAPSIIKTDIAIVGGGHAGGTLAALLGSHGIACVCIDQDDPARTVTNSFDGRTTAISFGSRRVIEAAGAWDALEAGACPIKDIIIKDSGSPTLLEFLSQDVPADAFGWIVENRNLRKALYARMGDLKLVQHIAPAKVDDFSVTDDHADVKLSDGRTVRAQLIVGADGRGSFTRQWMGISTRGWSYRQRGIVCVVTHENPHNNIAVEDFRGEGPFAILPMSDDENGKYRSSIVWTEHGAEKNSSIHWDEETFRAAVQERFPDFYGRIESVGIRFSYPLSLAHAHHYTAPRMALIADAAHGIHPIAGQGLNLGLRDIAELVDILIGARKRGTNFGNAEILEAYQRARRLDNMTMAGATDVLNRLFSNDIVPVRIARKIGLRLVQKSPAAQKFFMKQAMGSSGHLPALIRDGKFKNA